MLRLLWLASLLVASAHAAEEGEWRMPARDYASTRYSPLADITTANVRELKEAWNFTTGVQAGHEAARASIMEGRPNGMPAFRAKLNEDQAWQLVAYVRSMSGWARKEAAPARNDSLYPGEPESR